jgi:hypothetical protein
MITEFIIETGNYSIMKLNESCWNMLKMVGHTRLEPKMRQIRQYKKGERLSHF